MLAYLIEVQVCIALFWIVYRLFMHNSAAFTHNRLYLQGTMVLSFVIPALSIPILPAPEFIPVPMVDDWEPIIRIWDEPEAVPSVWNWKTLAGWGYALGAAVLLVMALTQLFRLAWLIRRGRLSRVGKARLVDSDRVPSAYSFFNYIFLNSEQTGREKLPQIVAHEMAHIRLRHSYDSVFAQMVLILLWWNPFVWLWNRSLKEVHEFQADQAVLTQGFDSEQYIELLIRTVAGIHPEFVSGFSYSLIKKRLLMMTKHTNRLAGLRTLAVVPALAVLLLLFSFTERPVKNTTGPDKEIVITVNRDASGNWTHSSLEGIKEAGEAGAAAVIEAEPNTPMGVVSDLKQSLREAGVLQISYREATPAESTSQQTPPPGDSDAPFMIVENMPQFQGGDLNTFRIWVQGQLRYPAIAQQNGIQGRVTLSFIIEKDGTVSNIQVINSPDRALSDEAVRVVGLSPKWTPGKQRGEVVRVSYSLPVTFSLASGEQSTAASTPPPADTDDSFMIVENMPKFEDGDVQTFRRWVQSRLNYPVVAQQNGIQGRVVVGFVVEKDGTLGDIEVVSSPDPVLGNEAMRVVGMSPKWTPGTQRGQAVRVNYTMPLTFVLDGGGTDPISQLFGSNSTPLDESVLYYVNNELKNAEFLRSINPNLIESIDVIKSTAPNRVYVTLKDGPKPDYSSLNQANQLNDVVVVGYGVLNKEESDDSGGIQIRSRGSQNVSGSQPLYIIDGKRSVMDGLSQIAPSSIESISVLKDEEAIAKYGEDGKNGVVIITLKKE